MKATPPTPKKDGPIVLFVYVTVADPANVDFEIGFSNHLTPVDKVNIVNALKKQLDKDLLGVGV